jgi:hypothetical protein
MPSDYIATTIKRLKNTFADYDNQLIKTSEILQTFDKKNTAGSFWRQSWTP